MPPLHWRLNDDLPERIKGVMLCLWFIYHDDDTTSVFDDTPLKECIYHEYQNYLAFL